MLTLDSVGPLELLVLQPTPFCNIDCSYCYLPDRQNPRKMSLDTLEAAFSWVFSSGLVRESFTVLWHAGEPLVVPPEFYDRASALLAQYNRTGIPVLQSVQTNGTLINDAWCDLFTRHAIQVGLSVDGPAFLHDRHRHTRQGAGTFDKVLQGIHCLQRNNVPFYTLSVLTADSLLYPDELFDFFREHQISLVAFNVEEIEGPNKTSSLLGHQVQERFRRFLTRFLELALSLDPPMQVREFDTAAETALRHRFAPGARTQENKPFAIVNIGCDGDFSTYSPELLGLSSPRHGSFALGNVRTDSLEAVLALPRFVTMEEEVARGVRMCEEKCRYFSFCGGGAPGNKFFENGTFASTETLFCRLHKKVCTDVALSTLERMQAGCR